MINIILAIIYALAGFGILLFYNPKNWEDYGIGLLIGTLFVFALNRLWLWLDKLDPIPFHPLSNQNVRKVDPKQVIIMRKDLGLRKGKLIAQGAHSVLKPFFIDYLTRIEERKFLLDLDFDGGDEIIEWIENRFKKICLQVESEEELLQIYTRAEEAGLPCALVVDAGMTEIPPNTPTCCSIGPADPKKIDEITGNLRLY